MKHLLRIFAAGMALVLVEPIVTQETGEVMSVAVKPAATLRADASTTAKALGTVPFGSTVRVIGAPGGASEVMNVTGTWLNVEYQGKTGWIFGELLKRPGEGHTVRIMNGTIVREDKAAKISAELAQLVEAANATGATVEIQSPADAFMQCNGSLSLTRGGKVNGAANTFNCGGASAESHYSVSEWHVIGGRLYFTAQKTSNEICHSENCKETPRKQKTTRELRNVKVVAAGKFSAEF